MQTLIISPFDTVYFRDGKSFTMGEETTSSAVFPPYPSVIYGLLRANYFVENVHDFPKVNKEGDPTVALNIHLFQLQTQAGKRLFAMPLDIVSYKEKKDKQASEKVEKLSVLTLKEKGNLVSNYNATDCSHLLMMDKSQKVEDLGGKAFLNEDEVKKYLKNPHDLTVENIVKLADYISYDAKVGIKRNRESYITEDGHLYRMQYVRMMKRDDSGEDKALVFRVEYEGIKIMKPKLSQIGAEAKGAILTDVTGTETLIDCPILLENPSTEKQCVVKIYLVAPAIFEEGGLPKQLLAAHGLTLIAAAVGKPQSIGGYDMVTQQPKMMYKAVPAGSVYFVKGTEENVQKFIQSYHYGKSKFTDKLPEQGYGRCFVGKVQSF